MPDATPPGFRERVRDSFSRQRLMQTLGATLERVEDGEVEITMPFRPEFTQQHEALHAGVLASVLDSACGYAAYTRMPADADVLSVEFKLNLLAPAFGEFLVARAKLVRAGRTISVVSADGFMRRDATETLVATMTGTMMCVRRPVEVR